MDNATVSQRANASKKDCVKIRVELFDALFTIKNKTPVKIIIAEQMKYCFIFIKKAMGIKCIPTTIVKANIIDLSK